MPPQSCWLDWVPPQVPADAVPFIVTIRPPDLVGTSEPQARAAAEVQAQTRRDRDSGFRHHPGLLACSSQNPGAEAGPARRTR